MSRQFVVVGLGRIGISMVATATLKEVGVPKIVARATGAIHARVLEKVGADSVIQPEREIGEQLARTMASPAMLDYVDFGEDEALIEAMVPPEWLDKSLAELALSREFGLTVVALKPKGGPASCPTATTFCTKGTCS